jgi:putative sigma-54 modulation protein
MNIAITFRQMEATDSVKAYANDKIGKLQKFLRQPMKSQVTVSCQGRQHIVEVDMHSGGAHYHAHETSEDMYTTLDKVADKLERQIRAAKDTNKGGERASSRLLPESGVDE